MLLIGSCYVLVYALVIDVILVTVDKEKVIPTFCRFSIYTVKQHYYCYDTYSQL